MDADLTDMPMRSKPMRSRFARFGSGVLCAAFLGLALGSGAMVVRAETPTTAPAKDLSARSTIEDLIGRVMAVLQDKSLTPVQRHEKVRDIAYGGIDFETLSKLTLGRNWRPLSEKQRADFVVEYRKHISATYRHTTDTYTNETINITGDQSESNGDVTVTTVIMGDKDGKRQEIAKVNYRLRKHGQWKVIDMVIDGVSLMSNFRSQFQDVIDKDGFEKLMQLLRDKNAADESNS